MPDLDRSTAPPPAGSRGDEAADVIIGIDVSGSTATTDPHGFRFPAARRIVNLLAEGVGGPPLDDRVGVVLFADDPRPWLPLTPIRNRDGRRRIRQALQAMNGGGTAIVPAIEHSAAMLGRHSSAVPVVLLFTDGESEETTGELSAAVQRLPTGCLHVVVLGTELPGQWNGVPVGSITALESMHQSPTGLEWLLTAALYRSLSLAWQGPITPPTT